MKKLILRVQNKTNLSSIKEVCSIYYVSKYANVIHVEIAPGDISNLEVLDNVISITESEEGAYLPNLKCS